jgi:hypothetical protein
MTTEHPDTVENILHKSYVFRSLLQVSLAIEADKSQKKLIERTSELAEYISEIACDVMATLENLEWQSNEVRMRDTTGNKKRKTEQEAILRSMEHEKKLHKLILIMLKSKEKISDKMRELYFEKATETSMEMMESFEELVSMGVMTEVQYLTRSNVLMAKRKSFEHILNLASR